MGPILLLYGASVVTLIVLIFRVVKNEGLRIVFGFGACVFVWSFFALTVSFLIAELNSNPPQRPMFHNYFGEHERALLPYWHQDWAMCDDFGTLMWADHTDNLIVAVIDGADAGSWSGPVTGLTESEFQIGDGSTSGTVTIGRVTNSLLVIAPDGSVGEFRLKSDVVQDFHEQRRSKKVTYLLNDVLNILTPESSKEFVDWLVSATGNNANALPNELGDSHTALDALLDDVEGVQALN